MNESSLNSKYMNPLIIKDKLLPFDIEVLPSFKTYLINSNNQRERCNTFFNKKTGHLTIIAKEYKIIINQNDIKNKRLNYFITKK